MSRQENRAIVLCENWQDKMIVLEDAFGKGVENDLARQKYDFLVDGINRISKGASPDEKMVLALIKKTTAKLEKQLYPNPVVRALHRIKQLVYDKPVHALLLARLKAANIESLENRLSGLGLNSERLNLDQLLNFESRRTDIELISPYGTNNYSVKVNLEKDEHGQCQMKSYTATLKDPLNPENTRSYTFDVALGLNAREAANLLQGRAILKHYPVGPNRMASKWVQLDFKNLDLADKPLMKETNADYEYNLRQEATKVAEVLNKPELASSRVLDGMEQGNQIALKSVSGETNYLEADPLNKEVLIRDAKQKPISLEKLKKQKEAALKPEPQKAVTRKLQRNVKQQQDQSLQIS